MFGLPLAIAAILFIGAWMAAAVGGLLVTRKAVARQLRDGHNDMAGRYFGTVSTVYSVVLGFVVVTVWARFADAERAITNEAAAMVSVFRDTQTLPEPWRDQAQAALRLYATTVPETEWPSHGTLTAHTAPDPLNAVWNVFRQVRTTTPEGASDLARAEDHLYAFELMRHETHLSGEATLPTVFWVLLLLGGGATIGLAYFFHMENVRLQAVLVAVTAGSIAALLFAVLALDHPFTGGVHVSDYPFRHALQQFNALNNGATVP